MVKLLPTIIKLVGCFVQEKKTKNLTFFGKLRRPALIAGLRLPLEKVYDNETIMIEDLLMGVLKNISECPHCDACEQMARNCYELLRIYRNQENPDAMSNDHFKKEKVPAPSLEPRHQ